MSAPSLVQVEQILQELDSQPHTIEERRVKHDDIRQHVRHNAHRGLLSTSLQDICTHLDTHTGTLGRLESQQERALSSGYLDALKEPRVQLIAILCLLLALAVAGVDVNRMLPAPTTTTTAPAAP